MKTNTQLEFPRGSDDALADLDGWLREFGRVVAHVSSNRGLVAAGRIGHLLSCWKEDKDPGENMGMNQQTPEYLAHEAAGRMEECWKMLLKRLMQYRLDPVEARRKAEALWRDLHWPPSVEIHVFHTMVRRCVTAMKKVHCPLEDYTIVLKYLELLPARMARALEDPLRRPPDGWISDALMAAASEMFSLERAYADGPAGLPRPTQPAAWANDRPMASTPLGYMKAPPKGVRNESQSKHKGPCKLCGGADHNAAQCPVHVARKDTPESTRKKGCRRRGGSDHWDMHHDRPMQRIVAEGTKKPCWAFAKGKCTRGSNCSFPP